MAYDAADEARFRALTTRIRADFQDIIRLMPTREHGVIKVKSTPIPNGLTFEDLVATVAACLQEEVLARKQWPEFGGKLLTTCAASGVACWCLDGAPFCAVGQLRLSIYAAGVDPAEVYGEI